MTFRTIDLDHKGQIRLKKRIHNVKYQFWKLRNRYRIQFL